MVDTLGEHMFVFQLTPLRAEPDDTAEQVSQILPGEPFTLGARADAWVRVRTAYDYPGWLRGDALGGVADPNSLWSGAADPVAAARELLGAPYEWGGMTAAGIDCSGLVHMSYRAVGRLVPRDAAEQDAVGAAVEDALPGDVVSYGKPVDHVAFWLGGGRILHATRRVGVNGVVEEPEPRELRDRRRRVFRL